VCGWADGTEGRFVCGIGVCVGGTGGKFGCSVAVCLGGTGGRI